MLATFATSDAGKVYGRTCQRYGIDPGAALEDDVMAYNLNLALLLGDTDEDEPEDEFEAAKRKSQEAFA